MNHTNGTNGTKKRKYKSIVKYRGYRRKSKSKLIIYGSVAGGLFLAAVLTVILIIASKTGEHNIEGTPGNTVKVPDYVDKQLIVLNEYSRPGKSLDEVNGIVIHYVGNPNTSAEANRNYFANLAVTKATYASSHFIIGLDGEIIQCVPLNEISYCSNSRNSDTIAIECCHPDETGKFTDATYASLVKLSAWLADTFGLGEDQIIRHYDVTGKLCPLYFVEHEDAWLKLKQDIIAAKTPVSTEE